MTGQPPQKKETTPTLSTRVTGDVVAAFDEAIARMRRDRSVVLQELVRAFLEYTADGRTPAFPLSVSSESYRSKEGEVVVTNGVRAEDSPSILVRMTKMEAYLQELVRLTSASGVATTFGAAWGKPPHDETDPPGHPTAHQSPQTEPGSHGSQPPASSGKKTKRAGKRRRDGA